MDYRVSATWQSASYKGRPNILSSFDPTSGTAAIPVPHGQSQPRQSVATGSPFPTAQLTPNPPPHSQLKSYIRGITLSIYNYGSEFLLVVDGGWFNNRPVYFLLHPARKSLVYRSTIRGKSKFVKPVPDAPKEGISLIGGKCHDYLY